MIKFLKKQNISTAIHYPIPIHFQKVYKRLYNSKIHLPKTSSNQKEILSLPINEYLSKKEIKLYS